ncbi:MFS transporter [Streptomyces axinellae]|uniref:Major facilitator superfamily (MFS) profile domain-containing protein n=1 Tax=Streptomyces axinellae TaxID=552788 RepID=A0ABP6C6L9_9ACTN
MSTRGGVLDDARYEGRANGPEPRRGRAHERGPDREHGHGREHDRDGRGRTRPGRLPPVTYVLALGTFLMGTTEFVVAGLLPEIAGDLRVSVSQAGLLITVFALGMVVGAPLMAMLTLRLPRRWTLILTLVVFAAGHAVVALGSSFALLLGARFVTAMATGAFWAVANVVATRAAGPAAGSRALGVVGSGAMLANVVGVPLGAFAGQLMGWRGPFWALAVLAVAATALIARSVPHDGPVRVPHNGPNGAPHDGPVRVPHNGPNGAPHDGPVRVPHNGPDGAPHDGPVRVPHDAPHGRRRPERAAVSIRAEVSALRSGRLWLVLAACATTTGGVLSTYSYIAPLLTGRAHLAAGLVPLVLVGFGVGALLGFLVGGRLGDVRPHATTLVAPAMTTLLLLALSLLAGFTAPTIALVALLGLFGLGANPVLISLGVRFAGRAPTLGSALTVSAFNLGTAAGSWVAGRALDSALGATGPAAVGTVIAALTLIPTTAVALAQRRRTAAPALQGHPADADLTPIRNR